MIAIYMVVLDFPKNGDRLLCSCQCLKINANIQIADSNQIPDPFSN